MRDFECSAGTVRRSAAAIAAVAAMGFAAFGAQAQSVTMPGTSPGGAVGADLVQPGVTSGPATISTDPSRPVDATMYGVLDRPRPDYAPQGVRVGGFLFYPSVTTSYAFDDNIFANAAYQKSDTITRTSPGFALRSDWNRHAFNVSGRLEDVRFSHYEDNNQLNGALGLQGIVDITREFRFRYTADYGRQHEDRSVTQLANAVSLFDRPVAFDQYSTTMAVDARFNRFENSITAGFQRLDYENAQSKGLVVDQNFRDSDAYTVKDRLSYFVSPALKVFGEVGYERRINAVATFDSQNLRAVVGISGEISRLVHGEVYVGYTGRTYDKPGIATVGTYTYGGIANWHVTPLLTVSLVGERIISETGFNGPGSFLQSKAGVRADYELLRNLILTGRFGYEWDEFVDTVRHDRIATSGIGLTYFVNRNVHVSLDYRHTDKQSDIPGVAFQRNVAGASLRVQY